MSGLGWIALGAGIAAVLAFLYWQLVIAEGAYLGSKVVARLYDWSAGSYERIKAFDPKYENWFLGTPLTQALAPVAQPQVLDVATGTGRLPRVLFKQESFQGRIVGLDYSRQMLTEASRRLSTWHERLVLIWKEASTLPFPDASFDTVTCLEALEFMPDAEQALQEMVRVLRPGGVLLTSNRIGAWTAFLPGRVYTKEELEELLQSLGLEMIRIRAWQEDYDIVWALKAGVYREKPTASTSLLRCPKCGGELWRLGDTVTCAQEHHFPIGEDDVVELETTT
jgi:SAM-dependent methyltransferase